MEMEASDLEEAIRVFESALSQIKWRLKPSSKSRLQTAVVCLIRSMVCVADAGMELVIGLEHWSGEGCFVPVPVSAVPPFFRPFQRTMIECRVVKLWICDCRNILALWSRMRPCIMVDYGGKMPELGDHLCAFLSHCKKESSNFQLLHVMVIDDMVYLVEAKALADFVKSSLNMETTMLFVDLENDPPKMMTQTEKSPAAMQLLSVQKVFSSVFHADGVISDHIQSHGTNIVGSSVDRTAKSESSVLVDLSCCLQESQVTIPTLNGWLLGYPVIYLFGKDHIENAIYSLSTKSLHIYQIFINRVDASGKRYQKEELMSFTVPYELSLEGSNEPWATLFLAQMRAKWENCKHIWSSLHMEVSACYPQAIAL